MTAPTEEEVGIAHLLDPEPQTDDEDDLAHVICLLCHPAAPAWDIMPDDIHAICGKLIAKGDARHSHTDLRCIVCKDMMPHHLEEKHPYRS